MTCSDVDECSQSNHSCQHHCVNTYGSYVCSCDAGHTLSDDGRTCDTLDCGKPDGMAGIVVKCDGTPDQYRLDKEKIKLFSVLHFTFESYDNDDK